MPQRGILARGASGTSGSQAPLARGGHRSLEFLKKLLDTPGPSGFEAAAARVWREEAQRTSPTASRRTSAATRRGAQRGGSPRIMLAGHIDEIGVMITHIDDEGFIYFEGIGGWDSQVLVGQRIRLLTRSGDVLGVIGKKPIHLMKGDDKDKVSKIEDLWIDIGAPTARRRWRGVRVGDPGVIDARCWSSATA
jgi:putative aminopeptidase FrvX